jgi:hypothetical protein
LHALAAAKLLRWKLPPYPSSEPAVQSKAAL